MKSCVIFWSVAEALVRREKTKKNNNRRFKHHNDMEEKSRLPFEGKIINCDVKSNGSFYLFSILYFAIPFWSFFWIVIGPDF